MHLRGHPSLKYPNRASHVLIYGGPIEISVTLIPWTSASFGAFISASPSSRRGCRYGAHPSEQRISSVLFEDISSSRVSFCYIILTDMSVSSFNLGKTLFTSFVSRIGEYTE